MNWRHGFRLADWHVYPLEGRLQRGDEVQRVQPKSMDVLVALAEAHPNVVEREALLEQIWQGRAMNDEPLTRRIGELRKALGDSRQNPEHILTVPKRGYRLLKEPRAIESEAPAAQIHDAPPLTPSQKDVRASGIRKLVYGVLGVFLAVILERQLDRIWDEADGDTEPATAVDAAAEEKIEELLVLLRNQAAANGVALDIETDVAIENAVRAIIMTGDSRKQEALNMMEAGDIRAAASHLESVAEGQQSAVSQTGDAAADTWREAGTLYYTYDFAAAVNAFERANELQPGHSDTLDMLGYSLIRLDRREDAADVFRQILALEPAAPPADLASAFSGLGHIARQQGKPEEAREYLERGLAVAADAGLPAEEALALTSMAAFERTQGNYEEARVQLERALVLAARADIPRYRVNALEGLGIVAVRQERYDLAEARLLEALTIAEELNDLARQNNVLSNLGAVALVRGEFEKAEPLIERAAELARQLGWRSSLAYDLTNLGHLAMERDDFFTADAHLSQAEQIAREQNLIELLGPVIFNRGEVAYAQQSIDTACAYWLESLPLLEQAGGMHSAEAENRIAEAGCRSP